MNTSYDQYKLFYNVVKFGNITKASEYLNMTQPGLSKAIKTLENNLGCTLFIRNKNGVKLTSNGEFFYNKIKDAIECMDNAEEELKNRINSSNKVLNIGISKTLTKNFLHPYLNEFMKIYPDIKINIISGSFLEKTTKVRNKEIDFIVLKFPCDTPSDFEEIKLKKIHTILAGNEKFKNVKEIKLADINKYPLILNAEGATTRYFLDKKCEEVGVKLKPIMEFTSTALVKLYIKEGYGIGPITKEHLIKELENGELFEIKTIPDISERSIGIIYSKQLGLNSTSREFIKLIKDKINK